MNSDFEIGFDRGESATLRLVSKALCDIAMKLTEKRSQEAFATLVDVSCRLSVLPPGCDKQEIDHWTTVVAAGLDKIILPPRPAASASIDRLNKGGPSLE